MEITLNHGEYSDEDKPICDHVALLRSDRFDKSG
jgi:hypothetical protein